jgi:hypothetical protein
VEKTRVGKYHKYRGKQQKYVKIISVNRKLSRECQELFFKIQILSDEDKNLVYRPGNMKATTLRKFTTPVTALNLCELNRFKKSLEDKIKQNRLAVRNF